MKLSSKQTSEKVAKPSVRSRIGKKTKLSERDEHNKENDQRASNRKKITTPRAAAMKASRPSKQATLKEEAKISPNIHDISKTPLMLKNERTVSQKRARAQVSEAEQNPLSCVSCLAPI